MLYPAEDRLDRKFFEELFDKYYNDKKSIGTEVISKENLEIIADHP